MRGSGAVLGGFGDDVTGGVSGVSVSGPSGLRFCFRFVVFSVPVFGLFCDFRVFFGGVPPSGTTFSGQRVPAAPPGGPETVF